MGMSVGVLDHFNIRTRNLGDTVRFYEDVLGLERAPGRTSPSRRLDVQRGQGGGALVDISKTDEQQKPDSGVVHHVAFATRL